MVFLELDCDLHLHGVYSGGVSKYMSIPTLAEQAQLKGLDLMATGDILNGEWLKECKSSLYKEKGCFLEKETGKAFVLQTEVNDINRVHHIIFLPDFSAVNELRDSLKKFGKLDGMGFGRPTLKANAETLAKKVIDCGGLIGPAHAFTPYFSVFSHFDSLEGCYKSVFEEIDFLELGLSADSYFADLIEENHKVHFLSCSDSHSPWPHRIGREFTRIKMKKPCFSELKKAFKKRERGIFLLNAGLDPREGKYHCTACNKCFQKYSLEHAKQLQWKCSKCSGSIKKGVRDRILELAKFKEEFHPSFRPDYLHIIPLAEIIRIALDLKSVKAVKVQGLWKSFVECIGSEISVLVDAPVVELMDVNKEIAQKIESFRKGYVHYIGGGGGNYGTPIICNSREEFEKRGIELRDSLNCNAPFNPQKTLKDY